MQLKTILNRVEHFKSFVYGRARWVNDASRPTIEVEIDARKNGRPICSGCDKGEMIPWRERIIDRGYTFVWVIVGHIEAYEALVPVYEWLGAKDELGLYDHAPRGHGFGEDDFSTILDSADRVFYGKNPESGRAFDQVTNPNLVGFESEAPAPISE